MKPAPFAAFAAAYAAVVCAVAAVFAACTAPSGPYSHYEAVDPAGWSSAEGVTIAVPAEAFGAAADAELHVRTTEARRYPYSTLSLEAAWRYAGAADAEAVRDTVTLRFDARGPEPRTTGVAIHHYSAALPLPLRPRTASDTLTLTLRHVMTTPSVTGISDVGLSINTTQQ